MPRSAEAPALIVGAGPTGLALATALLRCGVHPRIIDAGPGPSPESRALALHARTLENLSPALAEQMIALGTRIERMEIFEGAETLGAIEFSGAPTRYPFAVGLSQSRIEEVLIEHLTAEGVEVEWDVRLESLEPVGDEVCVTVVGNDTERRVERYPWVVGCDGVRSAVRESAGIAAESARDPHWFVLGDVRASGDVPPVGAGRFYIGSSGPLGFIPLERPGWWRVVGVAGAEADRPDVDRATIERLVAQRAPHAIEIEETGWLSAFRIREHVAERYRVGRVLIAGDAAHAHSPVGGQGMNTGIQDAFNLGWKLALVVGGASPSLLDSYEAERRPVAQRLVRGTGVGTRAMFIGNRALVWLRNQALGKLLQLDAVHDRLQRTIPMLDVAYPDSPITGETIVRGAFAVAFDEAPDESALDAIRGVEGPGERAPLEVDAVFERIDWARHTVLLLDGREDSEPGYRRMDELAAALRDDSRFKTVAVVKKANALTRLGDDYDETHVDADSAVHNAFGAETEAVIVIRPDGIIGWRAQPTDLHAFRGWWDGVVG